MISEASILYGGLGYIMILLVFFSQIKGIQKGGLLTSEGQLFSLLKINNLDVPIFQSRGG
tara:strand:- start:665 stop:844 length:180 start_codon:yes stop_codon:yes gene_type:complete